MLPIFELYRSPDKFEYKYYETGGVQNITRLFENNYRSRLEVYGHLRGME